MKLHSLIAKRFSPEVKQSNNQAKGAVPPFLIGQRAKTALALNVAKGSNVLEVKKSKKLKNLKTRVAELEQTLKQLALDLEVKNESELKAVLIEQPQIQTLPEVVQVEKATPVFSAQNTQLTTEQMVHPNESLRQSIEAFLLDQRSVHTQRAYGKDLKRFVKFLIDRNFRQGVAQLDRHLIIAYKDSLLGESLEHSTIDRHLASLRSFFSWLVDDQVIEKNPAEKVRFLNPKRISRTNGFTDEEVKKVLAMPNLHTRTGAMHYAVLMVLFYCGIRRSELCELRTPQLIVERSRPIFRLRGKGNKERIIPLIEPVWNAIRYYLRITKRDLQSDLWSKDQPLFLPIRNNRTGNLTKALDPSLIFYIVSKYSKKAGILNRVSPHSCRATAISNARDRKVADRAIQEFAGWSSTDMITRYDKRKTAIEQSAALAIDYGNGERPVPLWPVANEAPEQPKPDAVASLPIMTGDGALQLEVSK